MNVKVTCDSASDLPRELSGRYGIDILPLHIRLGSALREDRTDISPEEAYDYTEKTGRLPGIVAVSEEEYEEFFRSYLRQGCEIVHICLSGALSVCCCNARKAAEKLGHVYVVDSLSVSTGVSQLALLAAELANADFRAQEIARALNDMKKNLDVSFLLQAPQYLHRGKKAGGLEAFSAKLLGLKPEITLSRGLLRREKPLRGDMETSILDYVRSRMAGKVQTDRIFVTYSQVPRDTLDKVVALLRELHPFEQILEAPATSVVSSRCGPGSLGLAFMRA